MIEAHAQIEVNHLVPDLDAAIAGLTGASPGRDIQAREHGRAVNARGLSANERAHI